jgi:hypothetical protein
MQRKRLVAALRPALIGVALIMPLLAGCAGRGATMPPSSNVPAARATATPAVKAANPSPSPASKMASPAASPSPSPKPSPSPGATATPKP